MCIKSIDESKSIFHSCYWKYWRAGRETKRTNFNGISGLFSMTFKNQQEIRKYVTHMCHITKLIRWFLHDNLCKPVPENDIRFAFIHCVKYLHWHYPFEKNVPTISHYFTVLVLLKLVPLFPVPLSLISFKVWMILWILLCLNFKHNKIQAHTTSL